ncbi:MAG: tyrosine--tRNA ligase [Anaerolineae bacterium]
MRNALDVLLERGFVDQVSDMEGLRRALEEPITCYVGFDPSADSLQVGNLVPIMALVHMQELGHRPIVVVGGGTGMIGDPSGKTEMRKLLTREQLRANLERMRKQFARFLDFDGGRAEIVDNAEWLLPLNYIEFLREIGRHFSVNRMLAAETYRLRYESPEGLNFLEFNYQLLQAYDFLHLHKTRGCILQMGGSDQWGNILAGVDLIRRVTGHTAYALVFPLITTASGQKMGKTEAGTVWLSPERTSPYEYYQFWINTEDPDVERFLKLFTFLPLERIRELGRLKGERIREAKEVLAFEATRIVHGEEAAREAQEAARAAFGRVRDAEALEAMPTTEVAGEELEAGIPVVDLLVRAGLASSKSAARRLIQQGGVYLNEARVDSVDHLVGPEDLREGYALLRVGKKRFHRVKVSPGS